MKLVGKTLAFIKENKIIVLALVVVALSFVFLALPGQFAHYDVNVITGKKATYKYTYNGYQWFFNTVTNSDGDPVGGSTGKPIAQGVAIFVMLILSFIGLLFSKKSSFVSLLTSLVLIVVAILFFTTSGASAKTFVTKEFQPVTLPGPNGKDKVYGVMSWVPYLLGGLIVAVGLLMSYRTFMTLKSEIQHPVQSKGPTYSYLKK